MEHYRQALKIQEHNGSDLTWSYIRIARIYDAQKEYETADSLPTATGRTWNNSRSS